jgi:hypothetical protein
LDEPFLALMGWSLEAVLAIAQWSVEASPEVDLPRLNVPALGLAAVAIAIFIMANGRGRTLALVPLAAMLVAWLGAPQPIGYVSTDGSVFLKADEGWTELTDWRGENGLNPLIIGDEIRKSPCSGKGASCFIDTPFGNFEIAPGAQLAPAGCPTGAALIFAQRAIAEPATISPCAYVGQGGAVLELAGDRVLIRTAEKQSGRAWTQPLHERYARSR